MIEYSLKVIVLFVMAILALRLMGKSTLAQVTPHDLMAIVIIAALATKPILVDDFWKAVLAIFLVAGIHVVFAKLTLYKWTNRWIWGEPSILIQDGQILKNNLRRCEISLSELLSDIRSKGFPDIREVKYAILEPTGTISVLPQDDLYPVTPKDLKMEVPTRGIAISLVVDGQIQKSNLKLIGKDVSWLKKELQRKRIDDVRKVLYAATQDHDPNLFVYTGDGKNG